MHVDSNEDTLIHQTVGVAHYDNDHSYSLIQVINFFLKKKAIVPMEIELQAFSIMCHDFTINAIAVFTIVLIF